MISKIELGQFVNGIRHARQVRRSLGAFCLDIASDLIPHPTVVTMRLISNSFLLSSKLLSKPLRACPGHIESSESFVIQGRRPDSLRGRRCERSRIADTM